MLTLSLLASSLVASAVAKFPVAGTSRYNSAFQPAQQVVFSLDKLSTSVQAITSTLSNGANRTLGSSIPLPNKIYGVNVNILS